MRVVGVVTEVRHEPGLYFRQGAWSAEDAERVWTSYVRSSQAWDVLLGRIGAQAVGAVLAGGVASAAPVALLASPALVAAPLAYLAYLAYRRYSRRPFVRHEPRLMLGAGEASPCLPARSMVFPAAGFLGDFGDFDQSMFYGLFRTEADLQKAMKAEGGNNDLLIVGQEEAQRAFAHATDARMSPGLYIPHPKDPRRLIPLNGYAQHLLEEVLAEWVRTFEALGAKRVVIADTVEHAANAKVNAAANGIPTTVELQAAYGVANIQESTFDAGILDESRAVSGCWYGDYAQIRTIVEGRTRGRQLSWRKTVQVDASFGVNVGVLKQFDALGGSGAYKYRRTYDILVEFHPRSKQRTGHR